MHQLQRSSSSRVLSHPSVELLLEITRHDTKYLAFTSFLMMGIFLAVLCTKAFLDAYQIWPQVSDRLGNVLLAFSAFRILFFAARLFVMRTKLFTIRIWPNVVTTVSTLLTVLLSSRQYSRPISAVAILFGFLELTLAFESIPYRANRAISSLVHVTRKMIGYLLMFLPILIGYGLAFFVMLKKDVVQQRASLFRGDLMTMNMAAMFIGEINVDDITKSEEKVYEKWLWNPLEYVLRTGTFLFFLLTVPLVMMNLLLALTISDTNKFLSKSSSEYLRHIAGLTSASQRTAFLLERGLRLLQDKLPTRLGCIESLLLHLKWRTVLPRQFDEDSSTITLEVQPPKEGASAARVTVWGSKTRFSAHRGLWCELEAIVQEREVCQRAQSERSPLSEQMNPAALQTLSDQLSELRQMVAQLHTVTSTEPGMRSRCQMTAAQSATHAVGTC